MTPAVSWSSITARDRMQAILQTFSPLISRQVDGLVNSLKACHLTLLVRGMSMVCSKHELQFIT